MAHIGVFREVRDQFVNLAAAPASTTVAISQLARPGALFEVEAIAVLGAAKAARPAKARGASRATKSAKPKAGRRKRK
jgi:hypothetical protein